MHLISSLAAGIRGAENGTLRLYVRATSTRAVFYEDFIGNVHPLSGQDVTLDANGSAIVYVNQFVDVVVLDVDGVEVRNFVEGYSSPNIEVISDSFTGIDYTSSASGTNLPTNLQSVLDKVTESFGASDWNVLFNGVSSRLQDALGSIGGIFINVKSPEYGADGDGTTDDTTSIQNALDDAAPLKAIVIFPAGTYRITDTLTVNAGVSLWGLGADASILKMDHATADFLEYGSEAGTSEVMQEIRGIGFRVAQANSGKMVLLSATGSRYVGIMGCMLGETSGAHVGNPIHILGGHVLCSDSVVLMKTTGKIDASANVRLDMRNTLVALSGAGAYNGALIHMNYGVVMGCRIEASGATSGANQAIWIDGTANPPRVQVLGCYLSGNTGGTSIAFRYSSGNNAAASFIECGNTITGFDSNYSGIGADTNNPQIGAVSRESKILNTTSNAATVDLAGDANSVIVLTRTAAGGAQTLESNVGPPGSHLMVIVYNNSGGVLGADPAFGTGFYATPTLTKPSNGKISVACFRVAYGAGTAAWVPVAAFRTDF